VKNLNFEVFSVSIAMLVIGTITMTATVFGVVVAIIALTQNKD